MARAGRCQGACTRQGAMQRKEFAKSQQQFYNCSNTSRCGKQLV